MPRTLFPGQTDDDTRPVVRARLNLWGVVVDTGTAAHRKVRVLVLDDDSAWVIDEHGAVVEATEEAGPVTLERQSADWTITGDGWEWSVTRDKGCGCGPGGPRSRDAGDRIMALR